MAFKVGSNAIDTDDVAEGANKYYTNARAEGVSINNLSEDSTPQLGGALDVAGNSISSASNNNVVIDPNGTGTIQLNASTTIEDGTHDFDVASHDGSNGLKLGGTLVTATAAELNKLDGTSVTTTELDKLNGYTGSTAELNLLDLGTSQQLGIFKVATSVPTQASDFTGNTKIIMVY